MAASSDNSLATPAAPRVHEQPFGDNKLTIPTGAPDTDANHYAFLDTDKETATDHADFRQYSNAQGRWMAPDPYDGSYDPSNPQSLNRYTYAMNSPLSLLDPSGFDCVYDEAGGTYTIKGDCTNAGGVNDDGTYVDCGDAGDGCLTNGAPSLWQPNSVEAFSGPLDDVPDLASMFVGSGSLADFLEWLPLNNQPLTLQWQLNWELAFGTNVNYCGPNGAGMPLSWNDWMCAVHDYNYHTIGAKPTSNFNPFAWYSFPNGNAESSLLQEANQNLCNNVDNSAEGKAIRGYFQKVGFSSCN
jgi:RHS repeat-associated protein